MKTVLDLVTGSDRETPAVTPETPIEAATRLLARHRLAALPVTDGDRLIGTLWIEACVDLAGADGTTVGDHMTHDPTTLSANLGVEEALRLMLAAARSHLPAVDGERLLALVSLTELARAVLEEKELLLEQALEAGREKDGFLKQLKDMTVDKIVTLNRAQLHPLKSALEHVHGDSPEDRGTLVDVTSRLDEMLEVFDRLSSWYFSEKTLESKRVLLAESDRKAQILTKMALGGTGVSLDIVDDLQAGRARLANGEYDILCVNTEMIELAQEARIKSPDIDMVFLTADDIRVYLPVIREYPRLSNIVSRGENDRTFIVRSIATTINKLANRDLFGVEKYLAWGADVHEAVVTGSEGRYPLIDEMEEHFRKLGLRRTIITKCATIAEELLLNAIYDAPHDPDGAPRYTHDRTARVNLARHERALFRYACDGVLVALSVEDPFGQVRRDTILDYLESCYLGKPNPARPDEPPGKGGAGQGIFMVMEIADLAVFNVKPGVRSEVIALLAVDLETRKRIRTSSFHFFSD